MEANSSNKNQTSGYQLPPIELLNYRKTDANYVTERELEIKKNAIIKLLELEERSMSVKILSTTVGAAVTIFELDVRVPFRCVNNDVVPQIIASGLECLGARVVRRAQEQPTIYVEIPNERPQIVHIREVIESGEFQNTAFELPIALGKTAKNEPFVFDLTKSPNLLLSFSDFLDEKMAINAIMASFLYKKHPSQLKFAFASMNLDLSKYNNMDNYFVEPRNGYNNENPFFTEMPHYVERTLKSLYAEMKARYILLKKATCCNIKDYNAKIINQQLTADDVFKYMPYIVAIIAEYDDFLSYCGGDFEMIAMRLAEFGRPVGIHLIITYLKPSNAIINRLIKNNLMAYVAFNAPRISPQVVAETPDFDQYTGRGDMIVSMGGETTRVQCAYIDRAEMAKVVSHIGNQLSNTTAYILPEYSPDDSAEAEKLMRRDPLFEGAAHNVQEKKIISVPLIQRWFKVGQSRARRIVAQLYDAGIVDSNIQHLKSPKQLNMFKGLSNQC